jgi:hypothetical protein
VADADRPVIQAPMLELTTVVIPNEPGTVTIGGPPNVIE